MGGEPVALQAARNRFLVRGATMAHTIGTIEAYTTTYATCKRCHVVSYQGHSGHTLVHATTGQLQGCTQTSCKLAYHHPG